MRFQSKTLREILLEAQPSDFPEFQLSVMGTNFFVDDCRTTVLHCTDEWQQFVTRQASWVEFLYSILCNHSTHWICQYSPIKMPVQIFSLIVSSKTSFNSQSDCRLTRWGLCNCKEQLYWSYNSFFLEDIHSHVRD